MAVHAVAVIGQRNNPLYLRCFGQEDEGDVKLHYIIHASLDAIDERSRPAKSSKSAAVDSDPRFLGEICRIEDFMIFGYMTGTNVTLIVACKGAAADYGWVRALFAKLYSDYLEAACNPFAKVGSEITSPAFDARVESACKKHARLPAAP